MCDGRADEFRCGDSEVKWGQRALRRGRVWKREDGKLKSREDIIYCTARSFVTKKLFALHCLVMYKEGLDCLCWYFQPSCIQKVSRLNPKAAQRVKTSGISSVPPVDRGDCTSQQNATEAPLPLHDLALYIVSVPRATDAEYRALEQLFFSAMIFFHTF